MYLSVASKSRCIHVVSRCILSKSHYCCVPNIGKSMGKPMGKSMVNPPC